MSRFLAALRFLTVLPVPGQLGTRTEDLGGSTALFGVVGVLIGVVAAAGCQLLNAVLPDLLTCVVVVIGLVGVSGGLHMDGLSDTADGVFSSRRRDRMLEIMRDSRVGAMGVMAIVFLFTLKVAALIDLPPEIRWQTVLLMPIAGRCALVIMMALLPYARNEDGLGSLFLERKHRAAAILSVLILGLVGWFALAVTGFYSAIAAIAITLLLTAYFRSKLGGATGDTLGATCEIAECTVAISVSALSV
jgi:adenosylcobinamide-GDP ribazoletransferase